MNYLNALACAVLSFALFAAAATFRNDDTKTLAALVCYLLSLTFATGAIVNVLAILK